MGRKGADEIINAFERAMGILKTNVVRNCIMYRGQDIFDDDIWNSKKGRKEESISLSLQEGGASRQRGRMRAPLRGCRQRKSHECKMEK